MAAKTSIGVYCDKKVYFVLLSDAGNIETLRAEEIDGRLRHFKFINNLKKIVDVDLAVIYENDEAKPIINYIKREKKRDFLAIDFSPIPQNPNYRENPDLPTLVRKLVFRKKQNNVLFSEFSDLQEKIENLCKTDDAIHMRTLDGFTLAFMAAAHGIFSLEDSS
jgi:hypothetical protein